MIAVREGDPTQLAVLFERHHLKLYNFFLRLCGNTQWSEDMVQDTYMRMLKYCSSYRDEGKFLPWMFNIARNVTAQYLSREKLKFTGMSDMDPDESISSYPEPDHMQELNEQQNKLQQALLKLPAEKRELILLSKINLLSMNELSQLFNCSVSAVKVRLHRALELLRDNYETEYEK